MFSRIITFGLIIIGSLAAIYVEAGEQQNTYILVAGIACLMWGLFRLSKGIKGTKPETSYIKSDEEE